MQGNLEEILKRNHLSVTDKRLAILNLFKRKEGGLSHADIEKKLGKQFDRVTIYRTLQIFAEKGIIHGIPTLDNTIQYALCKDECFEGHHRDNHAHFICENCGKTYCLQAVNIPNIKIPKGFVIKQRNLVMNGTCLSCCK